MLRQPDRLLPTAAALALTAVAAIAGCGGDEDATGAVAAVPGTTYTASSVCDLLPLAAVGRALPGAQIDTSLPTPDSCFYAADAGDLILTVVPGVRVAERRGSEVPSAAGAYDAALSDAIFNGAVDPRDAPQLGDAGRVAVNEHDAELTAVWRRGDAVYSIQFSGWEGSVSSAKATVERLARALRPPS